MRKGRIKPKSLHQAKAKSDAIFRTPPETRHFPSRPARSLATSDRNAKRIAGCRGLSSCYFQFVVLIFFLILFQSLRAFLCAYFFQIYSEN
jgi:hypothetical protein